MFLPLPSLSFPFVSVFYSLALPVLFPLLVRSFCSLAVPLFTLVAGEKSSLCVRLSSLSRQCACVHKQDPTAFNASNVVKTEKDRG